MDDGLAVADHGWIVILTLPGEDLPVVESRGIAHQMPLADQCRLVACLLQELRKGLLGSVKRCGLVVIKTVEMSIFPREYGGPAGAAEGAGDKAAIEEHAILGQ